MKPRTPLPKRYRVEVVDGQGRRVSCHDVIALSNYDAIRRATDAHNAMGHAHYVDGGHGLPDGHGINIINVKGL